MSDTTRPLISIILPAYNEEKSIEKIVNKVQSELKNANFFYEVIVVDDGSTDSTYEILKNLAKRYHFVKAIRFSRNFGKESAILAGLKSARGNAIVTLDSDLQHPPAVIHELLAKWQEGYKIIHGIKEDRSADKLSNRLFATVFNFLFKNLGGIDMHGSSDYILIDREAANIIIENLPEKTRFYRGLAHWVGYKHTFVYFRVDKREDGSKSRFSFFALIKLARNGLVSFTSVPLQIISILGGIGLIFGLIIGIDALVSHLHGKAVSGYTTIIMALFFLCGSIMISLGIIGEYIAKIYEEVKGRPNYIVESTFNMASKDVEI